MIKGYFVGEKVVSTSPDAFSFYEKSRFGEKKTKKVEYSNVEVLYLVGKGKMEVVVGNKVVLEEALLRRFKRKDRKIETKSVVFDDLRGKGYIVKTALKFGAEFRVYEKGVKPGEDHADWLLATVKESEQMKWHEFSAKSRVAHSTRKKLLLGVVDEEGDVTYYEVGWVKL
jgi:tRNA-intron endonuclease, archaea type